ncbi:MAG: phosphoribosyltransferase family protein [bacterium]
MRKTYRLDLCGLTRELPVIGYAPGKSIPSFVILGDTELVCRVAPEVVSRLPEVDAIVSAEAKGIPLVHEVSRLLGMNYVVARKNIKAYMDEPMLEEIVADDSYKPDVLCINGPDIEAIKGKRVAIVDDVISTGASVDALERLVTRAGGRVVARAAVLALGEAANRDDIIYLGVLPVLEE